MRYQNMDICECDRCGEKEPLAKDAPNQARWHDRKRVTADGNEEPFLLCDVCNQDYREHMLTADKDFALFMAEKRGGVR